MTKSKFKVTKKGFSYSGDLAECIEIAKKKIERLNKNTDYIMRRHMEEERRFKAHFKALSDTKEFVVVAQDEIKRQIVAQIAAKDMQNDKTI